MSEEQVVINEAKPKRFIPYITYTLIAVCCIVYIIELGFNAQEDIYALLLMGAKYNPLIVAGQYWRLMSCVFLHGSTMHLFFNMYALFVWGPLTERMFGRVKLLGIFIISGLMGSLMSFAFIDNVSVGASGAIFGLLGAQLSLYFRNRELFKRLFNAKFFIIIALNLFSGFILPHIDWAGHLGGFIGGLLCSMMLGFRRDAQHKLSTRLISLALLAATACGLFIIGYNITI